MSPTRPRRRLALALTLGVVLLLGATAPAGAAKAPKLVLNGGDRWFTHDVGWYEVVRGPATVEIGRRAYSGELAATIQPDDHTMPAPGECEPGMTFVFVQDIAGAELFLSSVGDVCGHEVQEPYSVVVYSYTGEAYVEAAGVKAVTGKTGFLDIRMAQDGRANVFATAA